MQSTISPQYQPLLQQHQLANFEQLWDYQGDWFEPPNRERGGWSGVNYIELADATGKLQGFYLKRQQAHMRHTWRHPFAGEPTFVREFEILEYLNKCNVATPKFVFFGSQQDKAILLTEALTGFMAADDWLKRHTNISIHQQRMLMRALANAVRQLHQAGVQHRSLYLKHLFVKGSGAGFEKGSFEVATIDFEKSRITAFIAWFRLADLITLNYRAVNLRASNKLAFFKHYFGINSLTGNTLNTRHKFLCRFLNKKSLQKST